MKSADELKNFGLYLCHVIENTAAKIRRFAAFGLQLFLGSPTQSGLPVNKRSCKKGNFQMKIIILTRKNLLKSQVLTKFHYDCPPWPFLHPFPLPSRGKNLVLLRRPRTDARRLLLLLAQSRLTRAFLRSSSSRRRSVKPTWRPACWTRKDNARNFARQKRASLKAFFSKGSGTPNGRIVKARHGQCIELLSCCCC